MFCSWDILHFHILNHSANFENCDVMADISTQVGSNFWVYLLNRESFGHESWSADIALSTLSGKTLFNLKDRVLNPGPL